MRYRLYIQFLDGRWWRIDFYNAVQRQGFLSTVRPAVQAWGHNDDDLTKGEPALHLEDGVPQGVEIHHWTDHAR